MCRGRSLTPRPKSQHDYGCSIQYNYFLNFVSKSHFPLTKAMKRCRNLLAVYSVASVVLPYREGEEANCNGEVRRAHGWRRYRKVTGVWKSTRLCSHFRKVQRGCTGVLCSEWLSVSLWLGSAWILMGWLTGITLGTCIRTDRPTCSGRIIVLCAASSSRFNLQKFPTKYSLQSDLHNPLTFMFF